MHILFLTHYFPPEVNAPATRTYEHCRRWAAEGHRITVVTCAPNCPDGKVYEGYHNRFRSVETIDGIKVVRVWTYLAPNKGFAKRIMNYCSYMVSTVLQCCSIGKVDVLIATSPQFFCGWAGVLLHWVRGWPFVLEIRDIWPESIVTVGAMKKSRIITLLEILEKKMYLAADHIVAVGEGYRRKIIQKGVSPQKVSVVVNGVDPGSFSPDADPTPIRNKYCFGNDFICSYIGTVGMAHGLEVILKAAHRNKLAGREDIRFMIVGDGAQREELELSAKHGGLDHVVFTGRLPKAEMPSIIAASDCCLVHLRSTELFSTVIPSKIFEIMAMNTPIIMAVKGEALKIVLDGNAGVVMEPDDPESLLSCIKQVKERGRDSFSGREYVSAKYDRNVLAKRMLEVIGQFARRK